MCKYGAAMGRRGYTPPGSESVFTANIRRVYLDSGGYERGDGCTYWGIGAPLYRVTSDDFDGIDYHERASDRADAIRKVLVSYPAARIVGTKRAPLPVEGGERIRSLSCESSEGTRYRLDVYDCTHLGPVNGYTPRLCVRRLGYVFRIVDGATLAAAWSIDPSMYGAMDRLADDSEAMARALLTRAWSQGGCPDDGPGFIVDHDASPDFGEVSK